MYFKINFERNIKIQDDKFNHNSKYFWRECKKTSFLIVTLTYLLIGLQNFKCRYFLGAKLYFTSNEYPLWKIFIYPQSFQGTHSFYVFPIYLTVGISKVCKVGIHWILVGWIIQFHTQQLPTLGIWVKYFKISWKYDLKNIYIPLNLKIHNSCFII